MLYPDPFVTLPLNTRGRDLLVGDLHGQGALLDRGLDLVNFDPAVDRLIALGDLIDRGPDCERLLRQVSAQPWFSALCGNHEAMMLEAMGCGEARSIWYRNGNQWAHSLEDPVLQQLADGISGLPLCIELPLPDGRRVGLIHAEVRVGTTWDDLREVALGYRDALDDAGCTNASAALWGRSRLYAWAVSASTRDPAKLTPSRRASVWRALQPVPDIDLIVAGHSVLAQKRPVTLANFLWIETGAFLPEGRLSLVDLHHRQYWQVGHAGGKTRAIRRQPQPLPEPVALSGRWRPSAEDLRLAHEEDQQRRQKMLWWR